MIETHADVLEDIRETLINLVGEHHASDEITTVCFDMLGCRQRRCQHVAWMAAEGARPVINIVHLDVARGGGIHISGHFRRGLHARADNGGAIVIGHRRCHVACDAAGFGKKSTDQRTQRIDDTHLGGMYGLGGQIFVRKFLCKRGEFELYAVDCTGQ